MSIQSEIIYSIVFIIAAVGIETLIVYFVMKDG
jgi:hypothetical protein